MHVERNNSRYAYNNDDDDDDTRRTLFISYLQEKVTEELLYELCLQAGPIESVRIPKDKDGRQKNFGFVTYVHSCTIPYALRLFDGIRLFNQRLYMKPSQPNTSKLPCPPPKFDIDCVTKRNPFKNSALLPGSINPLNQMTNGNLIPPEPFVKTEIRQTPLEIELLSRLGINIFNGQLSDIHSERHRNPRDREKDISKYASRNNHREREKPYHRGESHASSSKRYGSRRR